MIMPSARLCRMKGDLFAGKWGVPASPSQQSMTPLGIVPNLTERGESSTNDRVADIDHWDDP